MMNVLHHTCTDFLNSQYENKVRRLMFFLKHAKSNVVLQFLNCHICKDS